MSLLTASPAGLAGSRALPVSPRANLRRRPTAAVPPAALDRGRDLGAETPTPGLGWRSALLAVGTSALVGTLGVHLGWLCP